MTNIPLYMFSTSSLSILLLMDLDVNLFFKGVKIG